MSVCWLHLTDASGLPDGVVKMSGRWGFLGVQVFFVISGFIIPYALFRARYDIKDYLTFLLKRLIRLDPPYLASLLLTIGVLYLAARVPGHQGEPFQPSLGQVLAHLGYINAVVGYPWLNGVYWTLAIEFQYYLVMGVLYFAIANRRLAVRSSAFVVLAGLSFVSPDRNYLVHWLCLFMLGAAAFQVRTEIIGRLEFLFWVTVLGAGAVASTGWLMGVTAILAALTIAIGDFPEWRPFLFLGQISYSLYLVHMPIGSKLILLGNRFARDSFVLNTAVLAIGLLGSIGAAWVLYRFVELPAQRWSSRIAYRQKSQVGGVVPKG